MRNTKHSWTPSSHYQLQSAYLPQGLQPAMLLLVIIPGMSSVPDQDMAKATTVSYYSTTFQYMHERFQGSPGGEVWCPVLRPAPGASAARATQTHWRCGAAYIVPCASPSSPMYLRADKTPRHNDTFAYCNCCNAPRYPVVSSSELNCCDR
jgi:hypothetical protein